MTRIKELENIQGKGEEIGREIAQLKASYSAADIVEQISENTSLSYRVVFKIIKALDNKAQILRNPPLFIQQASKELKRIELTEMLRTLSYHETGDSFPLHLFKETIHTYSPVEPTPNKGIYDHAICDADSQPEHDFARHADNDPKVVCLLKLPEFYKIPTPIGEYYRPDFGLVVKQRSLKNSDDDGRARSLRASDIHTIPGDRRDCSRQSCGIHTIPGDKELYFVIETKSTNDINDDKALTEHERTKIQCAVKHFQALGIRAVVGGDIRYEVKKTPGDYQKTNTAFHAPVKNYDDIKI